MSCVTGIKSILSIWLLSLLLSSAVTAVETRLAEDTIRIPEGVEADLRGIAKTTDDKTVFSYSDETKTARCYRNLDVRGALRVGPGETLEVANDRTFRVVGGSFYACGEEETPATITSINKEFGNGFRFVTEQNAESVVLRHAVLSFCGKEIKAFAPEERGLYCRGKELIVEHSTLTRNWRALASRQKLIVRHCVITGNNGGIFVYGNQGKEVTIEHCRFSGNKRRAMIANCQDATIAHNVFKEQVYCIILQGRGGNTLFKNTFQTCTQAILGGGYSYGDRFVRCRFEDCSAPVRIQGSGHVFEDCIFSGGPPQHNGIAVSSADAVFFDSPITELRRKGDAFDPGIRLPAPIRFVRCRFSGPVDVSPNTTVEIQWPLSVKVTDGSGKPKAGAYVTIIGKDGIPDPRGPYLTDRAGLCPDIPCIQVRSYNGRCFEALTPHTVKVRAGKLSTSTELTVDSRKHVELLLE